MDLLTILLRKGLTRLARPVAGMVQCRAYAREIRLLMHKACFGRLPEDTYLQYSLYTKHLTRGQFCPFLSQEMLAQMDACTQVNRRELHSRMLDGFVDEQGSQSAAITLSVTLHFEGRTAEGQQVSVHMENRRVIASLVLDPTYGWKLMEIAGVAG